MIMKMLHLSCKKKFKYKYAWEESEKQLNNPEIHIYFW